MSGHQPYTRRKGRGYGSHRPPLVASMTSSSGKRDCNLCLTKTLDKNLDDCNGCGLPDLCLDCMTSHDCDTKSIEIVRLRSVVL